MVVINGGLHFRVTKDVTLAAGKGVVHAGEVMADTTVQAGKTIATASVTAVQDTVDKTTLLLGESLHKYYHRLL